MNASHTVDVRWEDEFRVLNVAEVKAACERLSALSVAAYRSASSFSFLRCCSYSCSCRSLPSLKPEINCSHLGGSSCMVKNKGKCRKMTGFQRHQKRVVLMDILKPSQTSMAE